MNTFDQQQQVRYYRQRFADMPVGDPMSGAPYGEYLKSKSLGMIIGVVAAVAAVFTGGATLAAYAAGVSTVGIGSAIAAGAMVAGGVMSGVGIVTGNKNLTKIGGVLMLAGGIGGVAFGVNGGAGLLGKEASSYGNLGSLTGTSTEAQASLVGQLSSASETASVASETNAWSGSLDISATPAAEAAPITNLEASIPEGTMNLNTDAVPMGQHGDTAGTGILDSASKSSGMADGNLVIDAPPPIEVSGSAPEQAPAPAPASQTPATDAAKAGQVYGPPAPSKGILGSVGDTISGVGKFANENKALVDIGSKMLMGAMDPEAELSGAKEALYAAQTTSANATAGATDAQRKAIEDKTAADQQKRANANTQILMLDPRDPQYAQKKADAAAKGIPTMDMVTPAANGPVTHANVDYTKTQNTYVPTR
jgi:hypothetical protein